MATYYQPNKEEVKEARLFAKLTQQECADLCLVTSNTWARYEQGTTIMPAPIWKLFEYALAHKTASVEDKAKHKAKDNGGPAPITQEEKEFMENMLKDWYVPSEHE